MTTPDFKEDLLKAAWRLGMRIIELPGEDEKTWTKRVLADLNQALTQAEQDGYRRGVSDMEAFAKEHYTYLASIERTDFGRGSESAYYNMSNQARFLLSQTKEGPSQNPDVNNLIEALPDNPLKNQAKEGGDK
jgi:hypothetical protein